MADEEANDAGRKSHQMGILACISYVVGNVIGSGIFITPSTVLKQAGSIGMALIIWSVCGLISLLGGTAYIELGTGIPSDGGDFAYATYVGWNHIAFSFMFISALLSFPASTAIQALTLGEYVTSGISQFVEFDHETVKYYVAWTILIICTIINFYDQSKYGAYFQIIVTGAKSIILLVVVIIGTVWYINGAREISHEPMKGSTYDIGILVMATYGGLWSYAGWDILNYGAPAVKNPRVSLPISLIGGIILVTVIYVWTNAAFAVVLTPVVMAESKAVAADFADASMGPLAVAIPFAAAVLLLGSLNANIFCSSRIILEAAREGHLMSPLSAVHRTNGSPRAALIFSSFVALGFTVFNVELLINCVGFIIYAQKCVTMVALFHIRWTKKPVDEGVLRVPLIISILFFVAIVILVTIPFYTDLLMSGIGLLGMFICMIVYHFVVVKKIKPHGYDSTIAQINSWISKYLDSDVERHEVAVHYQVAPTAEAKELLGKPQEVQVDG